ncbi:MAG TPA: sigma factor [bacterium]|nr:sigma factor [bacterium]
MNSFGKAFGAFVLAGALVATGTWAFASAAGRPPDPDAQAVGRLRDGDEAAFHTWVGVLQGIGRFEQRSSLKTWIFTILMNRVRTQAQREGRSLPFSALEDPAGGAESSLPADRFLPADHAKWPHHWAAPPKE